MRTAILLVMLLATPLRAQDGAVGGWLEDYARLLQLTGQRPVSPILVRPLAATVLGIGTEAAAHPWREAVALRASRARAVGPLNFTLGAVESRVLRNDARPWGTNDGALWQGRGLTLAASGAATVRWGRVTATLAPVFFWSENRAFPLSPLAVPDSLSPYAYPVIVGGTIDAPQRFGDAALARADWGNSSIRVSLGPMDVGLSQESLWWGPGMRNDIMMTNHAPGFAHAHVSLARPVSVGIGTVTGRWLWGSLRESAWFDTTRANDRRYFTGLAMSFVPRGAPSLELGVSRSFVQQWEGVGVDELLWVFRPLQKVREASPGNPTGEDTQDQQAAIFIRWAAPTIGLEVYGEWAKGDHSSNLRDLLVEPEHGSAYLLGFQKAVVSTPERIWRVAGELTMLGAPRTTAVRSGGAGFFYVHTQVGQGYTHRGQVLGAGIGPGSTQLSLVVDRFAPWGSAGLTILRTVYDNDRYYRRNAAGDFYSHEVEPSVAAQATVFAGRWDFTGSLTASRLLNRYYIYSNDQWNGHLAIGARYHP